MRVTGRDRATYLLPTHKQSGHGKYCARLLLLCRTFSSSHSRCQSGRSRACRPGLSANAQAHGSRPPLGGSAGLFGISKVGGRALARKAHLASRASATATATATATTQPRKRTLVDSALRPRVPATRRARLGKLQLPATPSRCVARRRRDIATCCIPDRTTLR